MMYEEFQERTGRKDITFAMYNDAIEPLYMTGEFDKDEFCKMVKKVPIEMMQVLVMSNNHHRKSEDVHMITVEESNEKTKKIDTLEKAIAEEVIGRNMAERHYRMLELSVMFNPSDTIRDLRSSNFEDFLVLQREAQDLGIIAK